MKKVWIGTFVGALVIAGAVACMSWVHEEGGSEVEISINDAPPVVKSAIEKQIAGATLKKITKETDDGRTLYEAEYEVGGVPHSIDVTSDGTIMAEEQVIAAGTLPPAVMSVINAKFPGAAIQVSESVKTLSYEVQLKKGEKTVIIEISPAGEITDKESKEDEEEEDDD